MCKLQKSPIELVGTLNTSTKECGMGRITGHELIIGYYPLSMSVLIHVSKNDSDGRSTEKLQTEPFNSALSFPVVAVGRRVRRDREGE
jgi:hypothetical protein